MCKPSIIAILAGVLFLGIFAGPGVVEHAGAAEYFNPAVGGEDSASYWIDRGGLLATYGNYPAAVKAYNKALSLDPELSVTYYDLALAYGEMGEFEQAQVAVNRAIAMDGENGRYYYGRAWVLLRAFGPERALDDFQKAADLGDPNALDYLAGKGLR